MLLKARKRVQENGGESEHRRKRVCRDDVLFLSFVVRLVESHSVLNVVPIITMLQMLVCCFHLLDQPGETLFVRRRGNTRRFQLKVIKDTSGTKTSERQYCFVDINKCSRTRTWQPGTYQFQLSDNQKELLARLLLNAAVEIAANPSEWTIESATLKIVQLSVLQFAHETCDTRLLSQR